MAQQEQGSPKKGQERAQQDKAAQRNGTARTRQPKERAQQEQGSPKKGQERAQQEQGSPKKGNDTGPLRPFNLDGCIRVKTLSTEVYLFTRNKSLLLSQN